MRPSHDFHWTFPDGHTITLEAISTLLQLRTAIKVLKRLPAERLYADKLTVRSFSISLHHPCSDCKPCSTCHKSLHRCPGHG